MRSTPETKIYEKLGIKKIYNSPPTHIHTQDKIKWERNYQYYTKENIS